LDDADLTEQVDLLERGSIPKADSVVASGASLLISANPGCTLQISAEPASRGVTLRTAHTAEVLDASLNGVPLA
jgi:glycolate oxidase iron-sulfur subunit